MGMDINIGIDDEKRTAIASGLKDLLANSYTLFVKTHHFHWNVTGPMFNTLHAMFEEQYNELFLAVDMIAERIRSLGEYAPGSFAQFSELATVKESTEVLPALKMVRELVSDHETIVRTSRKVLEVAADAGDDSTADLVTERLRFHEKTAWMLRSILVEQ